MMCVEIMLDFTNESAAQEQARIAGRGFVFFMGPQRCGTTWIDRYLRARGDTCLPAQVKEIFFFDRFFARGRKFYESHFRPRRRHAIVAEVSTTAFDCADAPRRLKSLYGGGVRLICPLRHPVERSYSLYLHYKRYGLVSGTLQEACLQMPQILESSRYADHLQNWMEHFPRGNFHFLLQEELERDVESFARALCVKMGIAFVSVPGKLSEKINASARSRFGFIAYFFQRAAEFLRARRLHVLINIAKALGIKRLVFGRDCPEAPEQSMSAADRAWLDERLGGEVQRLERLIGALPQWKDRYASGTAKMVRPAPAPAAGWAAPAFNL